MKRNLRNVRQRRVFAQRFTYWVKLWVPTKKIMHVCIASVQGEITFQSVKSIIIPYDSPVHKELGNLCFESVQQIKCELQVLICDVVEI